jgi:hypothetical protein
VEFALLLPVMLLLFAAALDLGRLFYSQITIANAAREGALEASKHPDSFLAGQACNASSNRIMCRVVNESKGAFITIAPADVSLACSPSPCPAKPDLGDTVSVTALGHFNLATPLLSVFFGSGGLTLSSTAIAQLEVAPTALAAASASASAAPSATASASASESATATTPASCPTPTASFTYAPSSNLHAPVTVTFTSTSKSNSVDPACDLTYSWNFGDGSGTSTSTAQNPSHPYGTKSPKSGYTVTLSVSNASGLNDSAQAVLDVKP